jgi:uncharacterized membrane protein YhaH (DUF805 family)
MDLSYLLFSFQGRIRRLHFWLAAIGAGVAFDVVAMVLLSFSGIMSGHPNPAVMGILFLLAIPMMWISIALQIKRCHDRDKSGWFVLIFYLVSLTGIGALWPLIELGFLDGTPGPNRFGPSPKGLEAAAIA